MAKYEVLVVSEFHDYVEVEAENEIEARNIAERGMSKMFEYMSYDNDYFSFLDGCSTIKALDVEIMED